MKAFKLAAVSAVGMAVLATPAEAHWRFTQWGMTADQVVAASNGKVGPRSAKEIAADRAHRVDGDPPIGSDEEHLCSHRLLGPLTVAGVEFHDVQFCFTRAKGLVSVVQYSNERARIMVGVLSEALGPPVEAHDGPDEILPTWTFVDREQGNTLSLQAGSLYDRDGVRCTVGYSETKTGF